MEFTIQISSVVSSVCVCAWLTQCSLDINAAQNVSNKPLQNATHETKNISKKKFLKHELKGKGDFKIIKTIKNSANWSNNGKFYAINSMNVIFSWTFTKITCFSLVTKEFTLNYNTTHHSTHDTKHLFRFQFYLESSFLTQTWINQFYFQICEQKLFLVLSSRC